MSAFACMMVYLCQTQHLNLRFRLEFSIVSVGTVFPLVFSIQQAFNRREEALRNLSILKGVLMGLYFCHRDWDVSDGVTVRANLGNDESDHAVRCAQRIHELLTTVRCWLCGRTPYESENEWRLLYGTTDLVRELTHHLSGDFFRGFEEDADPWDSDDSDGDSEAERRRADSAQTFAERDPHWQLYYRMYDTVSEISILNEQLMVVGMCSKAGEAGFSRLAAYLAKAVEVLERLRCIRENRTPFMLRYVSFILVIVTIVLGSPYFAWMCVDSRWEDDTSGSCPAGYFTAVLYVLVLSSLFHVQVALENPFDGIGVDDVFVNMDREFAVTIRRYGRSRAAAKAKAAAEAAAAEKAAVAMGEKTSSVVEEIGPGGTFVSCRGGGDSDRHVKAFAVLVDDSSPPPPAQSAKPRSSRSWPTSKSAGGGGGFSVESGPQCLRPGSAGAAPYKAPEPYSRTSGDSTVLWESELNIPGPGQVRQP